MTKPFAAVLVVVCLASSCVPQTSKWQREDKNDPLRGTTYSVFSIDGKYLTAPRKPKSDTPFFIVKCAPGGHKRVNGGYINGKLLEAYMTVNTVLERSSSDHVAVQYRLDDGKLHNENWSLSSDKTAIFLPETELNTVLYGHFSKHKEGTNDPSHKVVVGVIEHKGSEVVIQFDLPDPTPMADSCGLLIRKKQSAH